MSYFRVPILAPILAVFCFLDVSAESDISIAVQETEAIVAPRPANLGRVDLPALNFEFHVAIDCAGEAESLTLSVADTFTTLAKETLKDQKSAIARLTVPARQLTLAASDGFCIRNDAATANELLVPGFTTAYASLRCARAEGTSVQFASASLQVRLRCLREAGEPGESQESSPDK